MNTKYDFSEFDAERIVYVRSVEVSELPEDVQEQVGDQTRLYAVHRADGERLALVRDRGLAFALAGVPAVSFKSGQDLEEGGIERSNELASQYVSQLYHQVGDEWTSDWNFEGIVEDNLLLHRVGTRLANEGMWPNWGEGSEFKAVRDESAEQRD